MPGSRAENIEDIKIAVYNVCGKLVYERKAINQQIDLTGLPGGMYLLEIEANGIILREKITKL